ncbi:MAG: hypothetical protein KKF65_04595 [Nanoarchaeota archaeon]|nr:hypothetical protein [Nanoarchaeota archaeon]
MEKDMKKQKLVLRLIEKGFLTSPDFITSETSFDTLSAQEIDSNLLIMNSDVFSILEQNKNITAEWMQFESALFQKETSSNQKQYFVFLKYLRDQVTEKKPIRLEEHPVRIIYSE